MIQLTSEKLQGGSVTRIQGALDGRTYQQFSDQVKQQVDAEGRAILDFKDVESVNSEGLRALLALNHWIKARNGSLIVVGLSGQAQEAFKSSGCDRLLKSYPDTASAMQAEGMSAAAAAPPQAPQHPAQPVYPQHSSPGADAATIPARSQAHLPPSSVPPRAETEWVKRPSPASPPVAPPKTPKGALPILPIVGAILALVAIVGLSVIFVLPSSDETKDPEVVEYPEISAQASYDLKVGEEASISISTRYSESLTIRDSLPAGLELQAGASSDEWILGGTPEESGTFQITLVATGSGGDETVESTRLLIGAADVIDQLPAQPVIRTETLPDAEVDQSYSAKIESTGATSLSASSLPEGMILAPNGDLSGTFSAPGTHQFTVTATGEGGNASKTLSLTVISARQTQPEEIQEGDELEALKADLEERVELAPERPEIKAEVKKRIPFIKRATKVLTVSFAVGGTAMSEGEKQLLRLAMMNDPQVQAIKETRGATFFTLGYADPTGSPEANLQLSRERAESVAKYLETEINIKGVLAVPMGPTDKLDPSRREGNRAVEVWAIVP